MISTIDRKRIFIFVAIAYGISIALGLVIFLGGGLVGDDGLRFHTRQSAAIWLMVLMFAPTIANLGTRLITHEGWSNTLLRPKLRRGWPIYLAALFLPILATIVGGAIYYLIFPSQFDISETWAREVGIIMLPPGGEVPAPGVFFLYTLAGVLVTIASLGLVISFGEEFGWRGYLLPKLMPMGSRRALFLLGVIHGAWHWPIIFMGYEYGFGYWGAPVVGPLLFLVFTIYLSYFLAWVTLRSGSVWPAALGHAAINASALLMFFYTTGDIAPLVGPAPVGIIGGLGYGLLALLIFFNARALAPIVSPKLAEPEGVSGAPQQAAI
jgi:membrane protease YdiL (CAAX protease family)